MVAAERNMYRTVKILLERGADPNKRCGNNGNALNAAVNLSKRFWVYDIYIDDEDTYDLYFDFYLTDHGRAKLIYEQYEDKVLEIVQLLVEYGVESVESNAPISFYLESTFEGQMMTPIEIARYYKLSKVVDHLETI